MTWVLLGLVLASVAMSSCAQLLLKLGMSSEGVKAAMAGGMAAGLPAALLNPFVIGGLALYGAGAVVWLAVLARLDLSVAYPFVGLGFVMTLLLSLFVLGEPLSALRLAGTALIVCGVVLVGRSA